MSRETARYDPDAENLSIRADRPAASPSSAEKTMVRPAALRPKEKSKSAEGELILEAEQASINRSRVKLDELLSILNENIEAPTGQYEQARSDAMQALGELALAADRMNQVHEVVSPFLKRIQFIEDRRSERGTPRQPLEPWEEKFLREFPDATRVLDAELGIKEIRALLDMASQNTQRSFKNWFVQFSKHVENDNFSPIPKLYEQFAGLTQGLKKSIPNIDQSIVVFQKELESARNRINALDQDLNLKLLEAGQQMAPDKRIAIERRLSIEQDILKNVEQWLSAVRQLSQSEEYKLFTAKTVMVKTGGSGSGREAATKPNRKKAAA